MYLRSYLRLSYLPWRLHGEESACNVGDLGSIPELGRSLGEGKGYPFQYPDLENSKDCSPWGYKTRTRLNDCNLIDSGLPGSSVHRIFQARILEWIAISFSKGSSQLRDWTQVPCIVERHFTVWATREVQDFFWFYDPKMCCLFLTRPWLGRIPDQEPETWVEVCFIMDWLT